MAPLCFVRRPPLYAPQRVRGPADFRVPGQGLGVRGSTSRVKGSGLGPPAGPGGPGIQGQARPIARVSAISMTTRSGFGVGVRS